jgi:2-dehydropantoate 2-reductase
LGAAARLISETRSFRFYSNTLLMTLRTKELVPEQNLKQHLDRVKRIAVVGAGAIGGYLAARLAGAGHHVSVVQRGDTLQEVSARGLTLLDGDETAVVRVSAVARCSELDRQDIVFLTVKATGLRAIAPDIAPLLAAHARIVPVLNGIPWWYFHAVDRRPSHGNLDSLDPDGRIAGAIPADRIIGCVAHISAQVVRPGVVRCLSAGKLVLGEPDGGITPALRSVASLVSEAGIDACASADIRQEIWTKLIGNLAFNPISALTGARMSDIFANPGLVNLARRVMQEGMAVGAAMGIDFPIDVEQRLDMARAIGPAKLSMLQDLESGRAMEVDAIVTAVLELAVRHGIAVPAIRTLHALISERAKRPLSVSF